MRLIWITFLVLTNLVFGQHCDTIFSNDDYVHRYTKIDYYNCYALFVDSVYEIHGHKAIDPAKGEKVFPNLRCYTLFHSETGKLIQERWEDGDTTTFKSYYVTGELKCIGQSSVYTEPYNFWWTNKTYYQNGQLQLDYKSEMGKFNPHTRFYPDGSVFSKGTYYDAGMCPSGDYIQYFPNGQISAIWSYSQPNTHDSLFGKYQECQLLNVSFYDPLGNEVEENKMAWDNVTESTFPPQKESNILPPNDSLYIYSQFVDQLPYSNNLTSLKTVIGKHLKLRKKCECTKGIAWVTLIVSKSGELLLQEIDFPNEEVNAQLTKAIQRVKKWPPALKENNPVDTYIHTFLVIDR